MNITDDTSIGEIVTHNYKTAEIFNSFGIDFCCSGRRKLKEAAGLQNVDINHLITALRQTCELNDAENINFETWPIDLMADYIEKKHHRYIKEKIPVILQLLDKACKVHGQQHPELMSIQKHFLESSKDLTNHLQKEEHILFPYIRAMVHNELQQNVYEIPPFQTAKSPIQVLMHEHSIEGERFRAIEMLSNHYTPPEGACNTYTVAYALLKEFEQDLHRHIHLENNILFPKSLVFEQQYICYN